jgi:hypothetical protein
MSHSLIASCCCLSRGACCVELLAGWCANADVAACVVWLLFSFECCLSSRELVHRSRGCAVCVSFLACFSFSRFLSHSLSLSLSHTHTHTHAHTHTLSFSHTHIRFFISTFSHLLSPLPSLTLSPPPTLSPSHPFTLSLSLPPFLLLPGADLPAVVLLSF